MKDIRTKEYASFMEETLRDMVDMPVEGICIITKLKGGAMGVSYYNADMMDKIAFAGLIQQDAMLETLHLNGMIKKDPADSE